MLANNNNDPIYEHFRMNWYTKQRPAIMSTYMDGADLYVVSGKYL